MPGFLIQMDATIKCPHTGQANIAPSNQRVKVDGKTMALVTDLTTVAGCPFQVPIGTGTKPQPCVKVLWQAPATRLKVLGKFVLLQSSAGACQSAEQIPQGVVAIARTQARVKGI